MKRLDEKTYVAGQIAPEAVAQLGALGVVKIVNNRPDGEEPGQPGSAEIEAAARAAGVGYSHIPIAGPFPEESIEAMLEALESATGPVLAFCRSGMRSAFLWGLARAKAGDEGPEVIARAAAAGYDLRPIRHYFQPAAGEPDAS
jgi:uncharacterized protein (TIGR01244 family)